MISVANLIHLLSLNLGVVAIILVAVLKKRSGFGYLEPYMHFLIVYNLAILLAHFLETILKAILTEEVYKVHIFDFYGYLVLFFGYLRLFLAYAFLRFTHRLSGRKLPPWVLPALVAVAAIMGVFKIGFRYEGVLQEVMDYLGILIFHLVSATAIIATSLMVLRHREQCRGMDTALIRPVFVFFMAFAIAELLLRAANMLMVKMLIPSYVIMLGIGAVSTTLNLLNILYLRRAVALPSMEVSLSSSQLVRKFGITGREEEIIQLICQGNTNKEIAGTLFISPITVRDHLSNIYRKTGVRSRTQLAGLFLEKHAG